MLPSITATEKSAWDRLFEENIEGFDYFRACENIPDTYFKLAAIGVFDGERLIAGAPIFTTIVRIELLFDGAMDKIAKRIRRIWPSLLDASLLGIGSPYSDDVGIVFDPTLDSQERQLALTALVKALETYATQNRFLVTLAKNVWNQHRAEYEPVFHEAAFCTIAAPPLGILPVTVKGEAYILGLSANMRSNVRRKLKKAQPLRMEVRTSIDGLEDELHQMRTATIDRAKADYDIFGEVPRGYYRAIMEELGERAILRLYWLGEKLIGFTFLLRDDKNIQEKYTGMRYPDGPDNGLFFQNWMLHLEEAVDLGMEELNLGETTYITKQRLGCRFRRSWLFLRHRNPLLNWILRRLSPHLGLDQSEPELKELGALAPYEVD